MEELIRSGGWLVGLVVCAFLLLSLIRSDLEDIANAPDREKKE